MAKLSFLFSVLLLLLMGCGKEYSYEGGTFSVRVDTVRGPVIINHDPVCPACINTTAAAVSEWSFTSGNWKLCGKADTAIINLERTAFTFFGPSACSADTGMVITVYLDTESLNRDRTNLVINHIAFYCYDRVTPTYIFMSQTNSAFSVTIDSYVHATRIATGTFHGNVLRSNGGAASIESGRFKVKLI
jgi:hypothetical protein